MNRSFLEIAMNRWALHIDIEGFGTNYEKSDQPLRALRALMEGIYLIGNKVYPNSSERIFAHQIGDGFIVVGDFGAISLEQPIIIAIALMQHVLFAGGTTKACISEGDLADIQGCFPPCIREASEGKGYVRLGSGIMTTFSVMGTALIRSVKLAEKSPSGSLLIIPSEYIDRVPKELHAFKIDDLDLMAIDWLHAKILSLTELQNKAQLTILNSTSLEIIMKDYLEINDLTYDWEENTKQYLKL